MLSHNDVLSGATVCVSVCSSRPGGRRRRRHAGALRDAHRPSMPHRVAIVVFFVVSCHFTPRFASFQMFEYQDPLERAVCGRCLRAVGKALADPRMHLLIPMAFFAGLQQGVLNADFTQVRLRLLLSCC